MSNTSIVTFDFQGHNVRVIDCGDHEEWIAKDVCESLGHSDPSMAVRNLDPDEKGTRNVCTPSGEQEMLTITEAGLYSLILRSRKPQAKAFKRFVTHDVLPKIRRKGYYVPDGHEERVVNELLAKLEERDLALESVGMRLRQLEERLEVHDRRHPFGMMGSNAPNLHAQMRRIRDMLITIGPNAYAAPRKPPKTERGLKSYVLKLVDNGIRALVGYPLVRGARWEFAPATIESQAFSVASQRIAALEPEYERAKKTALSQPNTKQTVIPFDRRTKA